MLILEISTVMHCVNHSLCTSHDWLRLRDGMQLGMANRVPLASEVFYPVMRDHMLVLKS